MSPEAARGDETEAARSSDVWSLGITVFQMATKVLPYTKEELDLSVIAFLRGLMSDTVVPDITAIPQGMVRDFVASCLHSQHTERKPCSDLLRHQWILLEG
eukprot:TRINITY_DN39882_c0_g1_i1.p1 TRINITY_DN39882_c0_g1~~TRINITY_DN39882_c0_g1_i1.p1  ORF type:complete len:101 (+),score=13.55 TRINITY_DN39882_c0_g1_i1:2-304(+)